MNKAKTLTKGMPVSVTIEDFEKLHSVKRNTRIPLRRIVSLALKNLDEVVLGQEYSELKKKKSFKKEVQNESK
jgi:hypothetical protein